MKIKFQIDMKTFHKDLRWVRKNKAPKKCKKCLYLGVDYSEKKLNVACWKGELCYDRRRPKVYDKMLLQTAKPLLVYQKFGKPPKFERFSRVPVGKHYTMNSHDDVINDVKAKEAKSVKVNIT